jgi:hypothetical protein
MDKNMKLKQKLALAALLLGAFSPAAAEERSGVIVGETDIGYQDNTVNCKFVDVDKDGVADVAIATMFSEQDPASKYMARILRVWSRRGVRHQISG